MRGVAFWFFLTAVICVTIGMSWGIEMSVRGDHSMAPAHAHLNLVGWATLALFGIYYHLVPKAAGALLARIHYVVALAGVATMVPGIAMVIQGSGDTFAKIGSILTIASMLIFLFTVITTRDKAA